MEMLAKMSTVHSIRKWQCFLICRAGVEVYGASPDKKERLEAELISAFYRHIDLFLREAAGRGVPGLTEEMLKKTKKLSLGDH